MTKDDYVIICGDFGGVWDEGKMETVLLDWLDSKSFTTLFVDGNHENFDRLYASNQAFRTPLNARSAVRF